MQSVICSLEEYKDTATPLQGAGKLTEKTINLMQNCYGKEIRSNSNELYAIRKAVGASLWHCTEFHDNEYWHLYCPEDSWCPSKQSDNKIDQNDYISHINLPKWIHDNI